MVSGRAFLELVPKTSTASAPVFAAVSAPWSLAVELGLTLVGFIRRSSMNVYTGADRIPG
jgi:FdhD protein